MIGYVPKWLTRDKSASAAKIPDDSYTFLPRTRQDNTENKEKIEKEATKTLADSSTKKYNAFVAFSLPYSQPTVLYILRILLGCFHKSMLSFYTLSSSELLFDRRKYRCIFQGVLFLLFSIK